MKPIRNNTKLIIEEYNELPKEERNESKESTLIISEDGKDVRIEINDSKEAWVDSLNKYLNLLTTSEFDEVETITINFDNIRPKGERLKTFGGFASGYEPMRDMFVGVDKVLKNKLDTSLEPPKPAKQGKGYVHVRPIHILDIGNLIANNVVAGGVRRSAELFIMDSDDFESILAKYGINGIWDEEQLEQHLRVGERLERLGIKPEWFDALTENTREKLPLVKRINDIDEISESYKRKGEELPKELQGELNELYAKQGEVLVKHPRQGLDHRHMSNNSIGFLEKPKREELSLIFELMKIDGEPGFVNLAEAARRVLKAEGVESPTKQQVLDKADEIGLNPCVEIILHSKNVCNLTTVNVKSFVKEDGTLDEEGLLNAQRLSARTALRMTLIELELPEWDKIQQRDRLLGNSLTGWKDAMDLLGYTQEQEDELKLKLRKTSRETADAYADELGVNRPMFTTAVKPEGTLSQVAGGVSSGLHWSHSPYFIRRVRIASTDPLADVAKDLGWKIHAEVGTNGFTTAEDLEKPEQLESASTWVIDFPIKSGAKRTKDDVSVNEQFDNYFSFQDTYTDMNTSNTITVRKDSEWGDAEERVYENWDNFVGVSFLALDGGSYQLAPYEAISEDKFEELKSEMKPYDPELLREYEQAETLADLEGIEDPECVGGTCPVR